MKKTVKSLIIAASVAAIAGIGAVSFAAWSGTGSKNVTTSGNLGDVETVGYASASVTGWSGTLVPYDQPESTIKGDGGIVMSIELPSVTAVAGQKVLIKCTVTGYTPTANTAEITYKNDLYVMYQVEDEDEEGPSADDIKAANKIVGSSDIELKAFTATTTETGVLYFMLDSNDLAARNAQYSFTITLTDAE